MVSYAGHKAQNSAESDSVPQTLSCSLQVPHKQKYPLHVAAGLLYLRSSCGGNCGKENEYEVPKCSLCSQSISFSCYLQACLKGTTQAF